MIYLKEFTEMLTTLLRHRVTENGCWYMMVVVVAVVAVVVIGAAIEEIG